MGNIIFVGDWVQIDEGNKKLWYQVVDIEDSCTICLAGDSTINSESPSIVRVLSSGEFCEEMGIGSLPGDVLC